MTGPRSDQAAGSSRALSYPAFRRFLIGNFFSSSGLWLRSLVQGWLVVELTNSATWLGVIGFLSAFPTLLLTPVGGALADRYNRRTMLIVSNASLAGCFLLVALLTWGERIDILIFAAIVAIASSILAFDQPPRQAMIANLVEQPAMVSAIAISSANFSVARFVGPAIGGALVPLLAGAGILFGLGAGFMVVALAYAVFALTLFTVQLRRTDAGRSNAAGVWGQMREGFSYSLRNRTVLGLLLMSVVMNGFASPYNLILPQYVRANLEGDVTALGFILSAAGIAAFATSLVIAFSGRRLANGNISTIMAVANVLLIIAFAFATTTWLAVLLTVLVNAAGQIYYMLNNSLLQISCPDHMRGRVMSIFTLTWQLGALGALPLGILADAIGVSTAIALWTSFALMGLVTIVLVFPEARRVQG